MILDEKNISEVNRCLLCKNALCQKHCPVSTNIPKIMELLRKDEISEAKKIIFENNPLSLVCSIVCDHESQCFGNCIRGFKSTPIDFYSIEYELSLDYLNNHEFKSEERLNKSIAIVGSGPSGLALAIKTAIKGYDVTIFEKEEKIGGVLRYGIPPFRLDKSYIDIYENILSKLGVKIINNITIGKEVSLSDLSKKFDVVFVGIGTSLAQRLNIEGEDLSISEYALDYLKNDKEDLTNKKVIVIGGGNVAIDAARYANRLNGDTTIFYRKTFDNMPANKKEVEEALSEGVKFNTFKAPKQIIDNGIYFCDTENVIEDGKLISKIVENSEKFYEADKIIIAISQTVDKGPISCLNYNEKGLIKVDDKFKTNIDNVFACGDSVTGSKTVVHAINDVNKVFENINEYLGVK